jgi:hypothetical protein
MRPMEANFARMTAWSSSVLRSADTDGTMAAWVLHLSLREAGCTGADPGQVRLRYRMSCPIIDEAAPPKKIGSCQYRRPSKRKVPSPHPDYPPWPAARRGQRQHPHRARLRPHRPHPRQPTPPAAPVACGIPGRPQGPAVRRHPRRRRPRHLHPPDRRPPPRPPPHDPPGPRRTRRAAPAQTRNPADTRYRPCPGSPGRTRRPAPHCLGDLDHRDRPARLRRLIHGYQGLHPEPAACRADPDLAGRPER